MVANIKKDLLRCGAMVKDGKIRVISQISIFIYYGPLKTSLHHIKTNFIWKTKKDIRHGKAWLVRGLLKAVV